MRATAFLIEHQGGWLWQEYVEAPLRIETSQGQPGDGPEVVARAQAEINNHGLGQVELTVGLDLPAGFPAPGAAWTDGDEVFVDGDWQEVEALTLSWDRTDGKVSAVPQFGTILDSPSERIDRTIGAIGGMSKGTSKTARLPLPWKRPDLRP